MKFQGRTGARTRPGRLPFVTAACVATLSLALPLTAHAAKGDLYWANTDGGTLNGSIGHAKLDGTHAKLAYVSTFDVPCGVAADRKHLYWADASTTSVNRISRVTRRHSRYGFLEGASSPCFVALGGGRVYTTNQGTPKALLSGPLAGGTFKVAHSDEPRDDSTTTDNDHGVATDSKHVYWVVNATDSQSHFPFYMVKRLRLGKHPGKPKVVASLDTFEASGLDIAGGYLYLVQNSGGYDVIRRVALTDKPETPYVAPSTTDGLQRPCGVAVAGNHIYWADAEANTIGRANLDGSNIKLDFIAGAASVPCGITAVTK